MADPRVQLTIHPQTTEAFAALGQTLNDIGKGFSEAITPVMAHIQAMANQMAESVLPKPKPSQADYVLHAWHHDWEHPVGKVDPGSGEACFSAAVAQAQAKYLASQPAKMLVQHKAGQQITAEQIAQAFDIPLSLVADPVKDQPVIEAVATDLSVYGTAFVAKMSDGTIQHLSPTEVSVTSDPKKEPIVASGGLIAPQSGWSLLGTTTGFEPDLDQLDGDGDPFPSVSASYKPLTFSVLGKAQPVVVTPQKPVSTVPEHWPADGTTHTGPDGAVWTFAVKGGWIITEPPLLDFGTEKRAPYGWWCTACAVHWIRHTADPVGCESGGWLRPATSTEHKLALMQA